jgi:hypothetical protein
MAGSGRNDERPTGEAAIVISAEQQPDATVISAAGLADVALLSDLAEAARLVAIDGPVILDLRQVEPLNAASASLLLAWSTAGIDGGAGVMVPAGLEAEILVPGVA